MPGYAVEHVHYFTAHLRPGILADAHAPVRQQMYLRALAAHPRVSVHLGRFRNDRRHMPVHPQQLDALTGEWVTAHVRKLEEKGTDVNLAARMAADAFTGRADIVVALSNDSDFAGLIRLLQHEFHLSTGIIFPMPSSRSSKELVKTKPDFIAHIDEAALLQSQFSEELVDGAGTFHRPRAWQQNSEGPGDAGAF